MDYLVYVEHSAENLQFFLWYRNYVRRWEKLSDAEKKLAPEWVHSDSEVPNLTAKEEEADNGDAKTKKRRPSGVLSRILQDGEWDKMADDSSKEDVTKDNQSFVSSSLGTFVAPLVADANANAGLKWQACIYSPASKYSS